MRSLTPQTTMKRSKRYKDAIDQIDKTRVHTIEEGITLIKQLPVKFDAGVEMHVRLGIDTKKSEQIVRGTVVLPHGTGKSKKVAAFVPENKIEEAKKAGADVVGSDELIEQIKTTKKCDFEVAVATPEMMKKIGQIAKILGQQGLMPSPKTETVGEDIGSMIEELKKGKTAYRSDDGGNVHILIGRVSFDQTQLIENFKVSMEAIKKAKPAEAKGVYIQNIALSSSMGPGIKVSND